MNLLLAIGIIVAVTSAAVAVLLAVRRHAPDGSFFHDGMQRALQFIDRELGATGRVIQPPCDERGNAS